MDDTFSFQVHTIPTVQTILTKNHRQTYTLDFKKYERVSIFIIFWEAIFDIKMYNINYLNQFLNNIDLKSVTQYVVEKN